MDDDIPTFPTLEELEQDADEETKTLESNLKGLQLQTPSAPSIPDGSQSYRDLSETISNMEPHHSVQNDLKEMTETKANAPTAPVMDGTSGDSSVYQHLSNSFAQMEPHVLLRKDFEGLAEKPDQVEEDTSPSAPIDHLSPRRTIVDPGITPSQDPNKDLDENNLDHFDSDMRPFTEHQLLGFYPKADLLSNEK